MEMKTLTIITSLLLLIASISITKPYAAVFDGNDTSFRFDLIHRHAPQLHDQHNPQRPKTQLQRIKDLHGNDIKRLNMIAITRALLNSTALLRRSRWNVNIHDINHRVKEKLEDVEMPIFAGRDFGTGQYFVKLKVGTPERKVLMVVDTGSDLTWMRCRYKCGGGNCRKKRKSKRKVFKADLSSSFNPILCSSEMCKLDLSDLFSLTQCPTPTTPCAYDFRYVDGSRALGIFGNETVTLRLSNGKNTRMENMLIGCSEKIEGESFIKAEGVLGLGYSKFGFTSKAAQQFGPKFSYCLVDHLSHIYTSNYILFGPNPNPNHKTTLSDNKRYTKLDLVSIVPFYAVNVKGISVDGVMLDIPSQVWDVKHGGGTILDSGTSLAVLVRPAYTALTSAFSSYVSKFGKLTDTSGLPMEYCFNSSRGFEKGKVPKLRYHFSDGARFEPHTKSYVIDVGKDVKCLGFEAEEWPGSNVIGNILQQNYLWEFDTFRGTLGFAPSTCKS